MNRVRFAWKYTHNDFRFTKLLSFTDEYKFNITYKDEAVSIWREKNNCIYRSNHLLTFKNFLVMFCCCSSFKFCCVNWNPNENKHGLGRDYLFQQDNYPKHTVPNTLLFILYNCLFYLKTPPQNADINP